MPGNPLLPSDAGERRWRLTLGLLVGIRVTIPLVTLAFSGHALPGLPAYRYQPLNGDSFVYYAAAREFIASFLRVSKPLMLLAVVLVVAAFVIGVRCWRREPQRRALAVLLPAAALSLALTLPIHEMRIQGGGTIGWSMLLAIPLLPIRAAGLDPNPIRVGRQIRSMAGRPLAVYGEADLELADVAAVQSKVGSCTHRGKSVTGSGDDPRGV